MLRDTSKRSDHDGQTRLHTIIPALDGTLPLDREAIAGLAFERALMGAGWLARVVRSDGAFPYFYYPASDRYDTSRYNEVRHAGATYSLFQALELTDDPSVRPAAEAAAGYIAKSSVPAHAGGRAYAYNGRAKLGGQALALAALLERRRVTGDATFDSLIEDFTRFLQGMELADQPGRYFQSYDVERQKRLLTPDSDYFPGEALLALTRLAQHIPDGPYLEAANRAASYLIRERDGDIVASGLIPREDHWLSMALSELYQLSPDPGYATVAYMQADSMLANQYQPGIPEWWRIGGSRRGNSVNYTSTATKCEAMLAVWNLAAYREDAEAVERYATGALRTAQFQMRVQYTAETASDFPAPERVIGGWAQDEGNTRIRLDFVQHNISALIGVWHLAREGRLPVARAFPLQRLARALETNVLSGPNTWSQLPVIHLVVDIGAEGDDPEGERRILEKLHASFATMMSGEADPDSAHEPADASLDLGTIIESILLELQLLAGDNISFSYSRPAIERGQYEIVCHFQAERVGLAAVELTLALFNYIVYETNPSFDFNREFDRRIMRLLARLEPGISTGPIIAEAKRRGIRVRQPDPIQKLYELGAGKYQRRLWTMESSLTSSLGVKIASNKRLTSQLLHERGVPVPFGVEVQTAEEAVEAAERIGYPVVLKPRHGHQGRGVSVGLDSAEKVRKFFPLTKQLARSTAVIVEQCIAGSEFRILVINDQVIAVTQRLPAHVVGDGLHTIQQLIDMTNADPRRGHGHSTALTRIVADIHTEEALQRQGLTLDDFPANGRHVQLKQTSNLSTGGTSIDRTDDIHPDSAALACHAAKIVGLDIAGIDFVTRDITRSVWDVGGGIIEVNSGPGFRLHTLPSEGQPRDVGKAIINMLFPPGEPFQPSIVAVTGPSGVELTCQFIERIMRAAGRTVGLSTSEGIIIDGHRMSRSDPIGRANSRVVLANPFVDFAVLQVEPADVQETGLGFHSCEVAVVTGAIGYTPTGLRSVESVLMQTAGNDGTAVLDAGDPLSAQLAQDAAGEVMFFSLDTGNPIVCQHLERGGRAVVTRTTPDGVVIALATGGSAVDVMPAMAVNDWQPARSEAVVHSALAATAVGIACDVSLETIQTALATGPRGARS